MVLENPQENRKLDPDRKNIKVLKKEAILGINDIIKGTTIFRTIVSGPSEATKKISL